MLLGFAGLGFAFRQSRRIYLLCGNICCFNLGCGKWSISLIGGANGAASVDQLWCT